MRREFPESMCFTRGKVEESRKCEVEHPGQGGLVCGKEAHKKTKKEMQEMADADADADADARMLD